MTFSLFPFFKRHPLFFSLQSVFGSGILLRIIVFIYQTPTNNDEHLEVIRYILHHHVIPFSHLTSQAYHPPLYYVLALPWAFLGAVKLTQLFSLLLSIANLGILFYLVKTTRLLKDSTVKVLTLSLAAFLPQFVIFSNFISNDTLSYFVGTLIFLQTFRTIEDPTNRNFTKLAGTLGLGLLTKGTFLAFGPPLVLLVIVLGLRQKIKFSEHIKRTISFLLLASLIGSYKFVENTIVEGHPIVHNLDFKPKWVSGQMGTYQGFSSFLDINVIKLLRSPTFDETTTHSCCLVLYGTLWYPYIPSESNFHGAIERGFFFVPQAMYSAGFVVTLLILFGTVILLWRCRQETEFNSQLQGAMILLFGIMNLLLVVAAGIKYDVWSCFQARLLFPSLFSLMILFGRGLEEVYGWGRPVRVILNSCLVAVYAVFIGFFVLEIALISKVI